MLRYSDDNKDASPSPEAEQDQISEVSSTSIKSFVTEEHFIVEEHTKSQVVEVVKVEEKEEEEKEDNEEDEQRLESEGWAVFRANGVEFQLNLKQRVERERKDNNAENDAEKEEDDDAERYFIGKSELLDTNHGFLPSFNPFFSVQKKSSARIC